MQFPKDYGEQQFPSAKAVVLDVGERMKTSLMMHFWMHVIALGKYGVDVLETHMVMINILCMSSNTVEKILLFLALNKQHGMMGIKDKF